MSASGKPVWGRELGSLPILTPSAGRAGTFPCSAGMPVRGQTWETTGGFGRVVTVLDVEGWVVDVDAVVLWPEPDSEMTMPVAMRPTTSATPTAPDTAMAMRPLTLARLH